jgi:hypothetical protein
MTRHLYPFRLLVVALAALGLHHAHAAPVDQLRYRRPIAVDASGGEELVAVGLDAEVAAATETGFPDLRVIDNAGQEVSRIVRRASVVKMRSERRSFPAQQPRLKPHPGGGLEIELTIDPEKHPVSIDGFRIETPLRNFEQAVQVQRLDEADARWFFQQLVIGLDYCHRMGVVNRVVVVVQVQQLPGPGCLIDHDAVGWHSSRSVLVERAEHGQPQRRVGNAQQVVQRRDAGHGVGPP